MRGGFTVEEQYRYPVAIAPAGVGVGIDIEEFDARTARRGPGLKLRQHLLAQATTLARVEREAAHGRAGPAGAPPNITLGGPAGATLLAMNCTVSGGTSPTAVT